MPARLLALIAAFPQPLNESAPDPAPPLPEVAVLRDDTRIDRSCRVIIHPSETIADDNRDGVIHIVADHITVEFAPIAHLKGAPAATPPDQLAGIGIRLEGRKGVTLKNLRVSGYRVGLLATRCDDLTIDAADFADNYRQRLKSTPQREDSSDWLFPHENDDRQWVTQHGAALCVERSANVTIRAVKVRRGQNGIILDRVNKSQIYDNDCSFLSGWGLAMWRSNNNLISRNAFDFCVRGHSEGVYNRGQDSAGILCFEQCNNNTFIENSATHGGDGFFGFAGKEAIEKDPPPTPWPDTPAPGCNVNVFARNNFSFASAHGLELTFSHANIIQDNFFTENAICGIWGGYSHETWIQGNVFTANGGMAYGLERGAINMEHASDTMIVRNSFDNNKVAVHLWWDDDKQLLQLPGVRLVDHGVEGNIIIHNTIRVERTHPFTTARDKDVRFFGVQLRSTQPGRVKGNVLTNNTMSIPPALGEEVEASPGAEPLQSDTVGPSPPPLPPRSQAIGDATPLGARFRLGGRSAIIMHEWGPWDHESPMIRLLEERPDAHVYELRGLSAAPSITDPRTRERSTLAAPANPREPLLLSIPLHPGINAYERTISAGDWTHTIRGHAIRADWRCRFFSWTDATDPRKDLAAWRALADDPAAVAVTRPAIDFKFAHAGPGQLPWAKDIPNATWPKGDRFGTIARATLPLPAGRWRFITTSDDGIRLRVNDQTIIDNWTWHAPTRDEGLFDHPAAGDIEILVEHFEIDGYATLELDIERADR